MCACVDVHACTYVYVCLFLHVRMRVCIFVYRACMGECGRCIVRARVNEDGVLCMHAAITRLFRLDAYITFGVSVRTRIVCALIICLLADELVLQNHKSQISIQKIISISSLSPRMHNFV